MMTIINTRIDVDLPTNITGRHRRGPAQFSKLAHTGRTAFGYSGFTLPAAGYFECESVVDPINP